MKKFLRSTLQLILALEISTSIGCAYHAGYGDRQIPGGYRSVAVPMFKNNTHDVGVEVYFTNSMIRELERSRIGTVTGREESQVTLEGLVESILYYGGAPVAPPPPSTASWILNTTTRIVLSTTLRLRRNSDQKVLWEGAFKKEVTYNTPQMLDENLSSVDSLYNRSAHYQYIELLAADMMAEAHDRLTENF